MPAATNAMQLWRLLTRSTRLPCRHMLCLGSTMHNSLLVLLHHWHVLFKLQTHVKLRPVDVPGVVDTQPLNVSLNCIADAIFTVTNGCPCTTYACTESSGAHGWQQRALPALNCCQGATQHHRVHCIQSVVGISVAG